MKNKLAVQIICYKSKHLLKSFLPSLICQIREAKLEECEIHILDNDSKDGLKKFAKKLEDEKIYFYFSEKNLGFGCGHNFLSKKSESNYILITNADLIFLEQNSLGRLIQTLDENPNAAAVAPKLLNTNSKPLPFDSTCLVDKSNGGRLHPIEFFSWRNINDFSSMAMVAASFMVVRRSDFEKVGGFDKNIFLYLEDADLCFKFRKMSRQVLYKPEVKLIHDSRFNKTKYRHYHESLFYLLDKYFKKSMIAILIKIGFKLLPIYQIRKILKPEPFNNNLS